MTGPNQAAKSVPLHPTFRTDVAPLLQAHCAPCHRPGQAAPFSLLTYADAQKRARQLAEVTGKRIMPPWLPSSAPGEFVGQRSLADAQIETLRRWADQGAAEGDGPLPQAPEWRKGWQLGEPDLVVRMPTPYLLAAEGKDVYRNFVLPLSNSTRRFVRALEFLPGNPRLVHHAFFRIDATRESRKRDEEESGPGFDGLHTPATARTPEGYFLSWQPGQTARAEAEGLAWALETNCDLVVQLHLRPTGKAEQLQAAVGLYFAERPPERFPYTLGMRNFSIDIPAGAAAHAVRDSLTLPVDVDVLAVLPHAHFLGRELQAQAGLPDGSTRTLLQIPRWDISWQGDYRYAQPVFLPAGTVVHMDYVYDNSTNNPVNPHQPPVRVRYGLQAEDEMAEFWLQVLPRRPEDRALLVRSHQPRVLRETIGYQQYLLSRDPGNARALVEIGKSHVLLGEHPAAESHLRAAMQARPDWDEPHYWMGLSHRLRNHWVEAQAALSAATRFNPTNSRAWGNLGLVLLEQGQRAAAEPCLRRALALDPEDAIARETLEELSREGNR